MATSSYDQIEKLFRLYHKELTNLAFNLVRDRDIAKDIVQEVFLRLWQNREKVEFGLQIKHYLFKATSHTCLNHLRSGKKNVSIEDSVEAVSMHASVDMEGVDYQEFEIKVRDAIEKLPPKCKTIYLLSRHEGMKYQQIAEALDLSVKTVENQMGIALEKLRQDLKPYLPNAITIAILVALLGSLFFL
jgi:RNA polymerase sigma-70 factor (ECF subfamily)